MSTTKNTAEPEHNPEALTDAGAPPPASSSANTGAPATAGTSNNERVQTNDPVSKFLRKTAGLDWSSHNLLMALFSLVVMIASAQLCSDSFVCTGMIAFEVAGPAISFVVGIIAFIGAEKGFIKQDGVKVAISGVMFLFWVAMIICFTFFGDYQNLARANGYFGSWAAFYFAIMAFMTVSEGFNQQLERTMSAARKPAFVLLILALVVLGAGTGGW